MIGVGTADHLREFSWINSLPWKQNTVTEKTVFKHMT